MVVMAVMVHACMVMEIYSDQSGTGGNVIIIIIIQNTLRCRDNNNNIAATIASIDVEQWL